VVSTVKNASIGSVFPGCPSDVFIVPERRSRRWLVRLFPATTGVERSGCYAVGARID
jgi:hypothetical protein